MLLVVSRKSKVESTTSICYKFTVKQGIIKVRFLQVWIGCVKGYMVIIFIGGIPAHAQLLQRYEHYCERLYCCYGHLSCLLFS
ncbi:MAG: hypothetical protein JWQ38_1395 [Flavipsychrobacter sp.]|nr:hypothetical protein [Flavipsychrobacter sp.]